MREKFQRFMWGRYGNDNFNRFIIGLAFVCLLISFRFAAVYTLALALIIYSYIRMFSRNIGKRSAENQMYLAKTAKIRSWIATRKAELVGSGNYRIFKCPKCGQKIRVPKGRGKIAITCRKCSTEFIRRS